MANRMKSQRDKKIVFKLISLFFFAFFLTVDLHSQEELNYSFFVAGHVYGHPGSKTPGIYPPFVKKFEQIQADTLLLFGVLTGDIVRTGSREEWEAVDRDLELLGKKIHFALGNHDYKNPEIIHEKFKKTYYHFFSNNDLHIILDPNIDCWSISGEQLIYLKKLLKDSAEKADHIFVYFHQVLWWTPNKKYSDIRVNSREGRDPNLNFRSEIEPLFHQLNKAVFLFAGDIGAASWSDDYSYHTYDNMHLISSGMGEGKGDNFLKIHVLKDKTVKIELISIPEGETRILNTDNGQK